MARLQSVERDISPRRKRLLAVTFRERVGQLLPEDSLRGWLALARRQADWQARRADRATTHDARGGVERADASAG
jgi:hypothetical protein